MVYYPHNWGEVEREMSSKADGSVWFQLISDCSETLNDSDVTRFQGINSKESTIEVSMYYPDVEEGASIDVVQFGIPNTSAAKN